MHARVRSAIMRSTMHCTQMHTRQQTTVLLRPHHCAFLFGTQPHPAATDYLPITQMHTTEMELSFDAVISAFKAPVF